MLNFSKRRPLIAASLAIALAGAGIATVFAVRGIHAEAPPAAAAAAPATPVSVAKVEQRNVAVWDEFSGRLEAIERVEVRSRVAGAVQAVHFREGALVKQNDLLVTIDPAPYAADVERAEAQVVAAQARVSLAKSELDRGTQLSETRVISQRDVDQRLNTRKVVYLDHCFGGHARKTGHEIPRADRGD